MNRFRAALVDEVVKVAAAYPASRLTPQSSNVSGYRYDAGAKQLFVTFKGGSSYRYDEVPPHVARALGRNKSTGKTLNRLVKGGGYAYEKVGAPAVIEAFTRTRRSITKLAGVAKKQTTFDGLRLKIEHEPGDIRKGTSKDGHSWERKMYASYGYVPNTKGLASDGDAVDVYLAGSPIAGSPVFRVDQLKKDTKAHDEYKFMLGYPSKEAAKADFLRHMPEWALGEITEVPMDRLKEACDSGRMKTAGLAEYGNALAGPQINTLTKPLPNPPPMPKPKPAPANVSPPTPPAPMKTASLRGFIDELAKNAGARSAVARVLTTPPRPLVKQANAMDFILGEVPGGSIVQRGFAGGPRQAGRAFLGSAVGGVPGALAGLGLGKAIQHLAHRGQPINIPGINISLAELLAGLGGTLGAVKGLRHFAPEGGHHH